MQPEELPGEFPVSWAVASGLDARGLLLWQDLSSHFTFELHLSWLPPPLPASSALWPGPWGRVPEATCRLSPRTFPLRRAPFSLRSPRDNSGDCHRMCVGSVCVTSSTLAAVCVRGVRATAQITAGAGKVRSVLGTSRPSVYWATQRGHRGLGTGGASLGMRAALRVWIREAPEDRGRGRDLLGPECGWRREEAPGLGPGTPTFSGWKRRRDGGGGGCGAAKWGEQALVSKSAEGPGERSAEPSPRWP